MLEAVVWQWVVFAGLVAALLALDLLVFHRHDRAPSLWESALWTLFWCCLAAAFNALVWRWQGSEKGLEFSTGYVIEWSLSMDNVFVFAVVFRFFQVPLQYQYRVLFWGILGAMALRLAFVLAGVQLIHHFDWILPLFGLLLVYTALKLAMHAESEVQPEKNVVLGFARRLLNVAQGDHRRHGSAFFVREDQRLCVTPLFLVLLVLESTDVLFAVDSVPAILGITTDTFIVFTSNVFAILGLRALYFLLAGAMQTFCYLHYGIAVVLAFVGANMVADFFLAQQPGGHMIPTWAKLLAIAAALGVSVVASLAVRRRSS